MSSNTAAASKKTTDDSTSGVGHGEISDPKTTRTGDGADTKGEVLSDHPGGESDTSSSKEEGDHDGAAAEYGSTHYNPRGPPNKPVHGGPIRR